MILFTPRVSRISICSARCVRSRRTSIVLVVSSHDGLCNLHVALNSVAKYRVHRNIPLPHPKSRNSFLWPSENARCGHEGSTSQSQTTKRSADQCSSCCISAETDGRTQTRSLRLVLSNSPPCLTAGPVRAIHGGQLSVLTPLGHYTHAWGKRYDSVLLLVTTFFFSSKLDA